jgi:hypothetical protein
VGNVLGARQIRWVSRAARPDAEDPDVAAELEAFGRPASMVFHSVAKSTNDHLLRPRAIMSAMSTFGRRDPVHQPALGQVAHRQPDDHVVSRDAVRHHTTGFFRDDQ